MMHEAQVAPCGTKPRQLATFEALRAPSGSQKGLQGTQNAYLKPCDDVLCFFPFASASKIGGFSSYLDNT